VSKKKPAPVASGTGNDLFGRLALLPRSAINLLEPATLAITCRACDRLALRGKTYQSRSDRDLERKVKLKHLEVLKLRQDMAGIWRYRWGRLQDAEAQNSNLRAQLEEMKREQRMQTMGAFGGGAVVQLGADAPEAPPMHQIASPDMIHDISGLIDGFTDQEVQHLAGKELNHLRGAYADFALAVEGLAGQMNVGNMGRAHEKTQKNLKEASTRAKYKAKTGSAGAWCDLALGVAKQSVGYGEPASPKLPPIKKPKAQVSGATGKHR
jgi:hypothetical protein